MLRKKQFFLTLHHLRATALKDQTIKAIEADVQKSNPGSEPSSASSRSCDHRSLFNFHSVTEKEKLSQTDENWLLISSPGAGDLRPRQQVFPLSLSQIWLANSMQRLNDLLGWGVFFPRSVTIDGKGQEILKKLNVPAGLLLPHWAGPPSGARGYLGSQSIRSLSALIIKNPIGCAKC